MLQGAVHTVLAYFLFIAACVKFKLEGFVLCSKHPIRVNGTKKYIKDLKR
jgi:hypothetical protein